MFVPCAFHFHASNLTMVRPFIGVSDGGGKPLFCRLPPSTTVRGANEENKGHGDDKSCRLSLQALCFEIVVPLRANQDSPREHNSKKQVNKSRILIRGSNTRYTLWI